MPLFFSKITSHGLQRFITLEIASIYAPLQSTRRINFLRVLLISVEVDSLKSQRFPLPANIWNRKIMESHCVSSITSCFRI